MNQLLAKLLVVLACVMPAACATVDVSPADALQITASKLSIPASEIVFQQPARFAAAAPGERFARFQLGVFSLTQSELVLFSYSSDTKEFSKVLSVPLSRIDSVSIESWGAFNHLKQLQLIAGGVLLAVNFNNSSDAMAGSIESTRPAYDRLIQAGIKPGAPSGRLLPEEIRNYVVPIFIPVR